MIREPLSLFITLSGDLQCLLHNSPPSWHCLLQHNTIFMVINSISLSGEFDDRCLLLKGQIEPNAVESWLKLLPDCLVSDALDHFQVELFEEDGRLIKRLQGGKST